MLYTNKEEFKSEYLLEFNRLMGKSIEESSLGEKYRALVNLLREKISVDWVDTSKLYTQKGEKEVFYFSLEFLIGRLLPYYLINLGVEDIVKAGLKDLGINIEDIYQQEADAGLGNGGLGRLAACFLDSMAFLGVPGHGNGIRYRYGLFKQRIVDGYQVELPDNWLRNGYPWEIKRPEKSVLIKFRGNINSREENGRLVFEHNNYEGVMAVPYDIPMLGYEAQDSVNTLRLWSSEPVEEEFDLASFNRGDYSKFSNYKNDIEAISYILYPEDSSWQGRELRLKQEYFFVSAGLQDIIRSFKSKYKGDFTLLPQKVAIHINDTHPALCVPELMRILMDEEGLSWNEAWNITVNTISFTNHTIMPEALEKWPIDMMKGLLPRVYMIVEEIDRRFREEMRTQHGLDEDTIQSMAVLKWGEAHMANLSIIGSQSVNGVAKLHSEILKENVFADFYHVYPYKFNNKTNGVAHRRFLHMANPGLSKLITKKIGPDWLKRPQDMEQLLSLKNQTRFLKQLGDVKRANKERLADYIFKTTGISTDPNSVFDIHVKRIHAYKRQLMNALRIMDMRNRLKDDPTMPFTPHTFIFAGKAAPGYAYAKKVIKLITSIADLVNNDPELDDKMKVVFLENFNVSTAEMIYPAADISEQISTASKEASGTGNMKFMMNGALTLGTLDGANVEIRDMVGDDNIKIFGLTAEEVISYYMRGGYTSWELYHDDARIRRVVDQLVDGTFPGVGAEFQDIFDGLLRDNDMFFVLKDLIPYIEAWEELCRDYQDQKKWQQKALVNIAKSWQFSSDRTIREYADDIWRTSYKKY